MFFEPYVEHAETPRPRIKFAVRPATLDDLPALNKIRWTRNGKANVTRVTDMFVAQSNHQLIGFSGIKYSEEGTAPHGWYLAGVIILPEFRRLGVATGLTQARLDLIRQRAYHAYYFANEHNQSSISMHERFGLVELTRRFSIPGVTFKGGGGILFKTTTLNYRGVNDESTQ